MTKLEQLAKDGVVVVADNSSHVQLGELTPYQLPENMLEQLRGLQELLAGRE